MGEQSYITRFRAQEEGFRQLTTELRNMGAIGDDAFKRIEESSQRANRGLTAVDTTSGRLSTTFSGVTRNLLAFSGGFAVFSGIRSVIGSTLDALGDFEVEFNNVRTLVDENVVSTQNLNEELRQLPAALGDSAQLARGLYQAISASVDPAQAVRFVGESALFAKAALVETNTAVDVGTTILNAYGKEASEAGKVFDVLFETIRRGKTTGEELSESIGTVAPIAKAAGFSIEEVAAALAVLTRGGIRTDIAVTGLRGAFVQFIQQADKFREAGVDIQSVIRDRGIIGAFEELEQVTKGAGEAVAQFIPEIRGRVAALSLLGPGLQSLKVDLDAITASDGAVGEGAKKQLEGYRSAWEELGNTWDRIQQKGTFLSELLEGVALGIKGFLEPLGEDKLARLNRDLEFLQERYGSLLSEGDRHPAVDFIRRLFGRNKQEIIGEIRELEIEVQNLALARSPAGQFPSERIEEQKRQAAELARIAEIQRREEERINKEAAAKRQAVLDEEAATRARQAEATRQRLEAIEQAYANRTIQIFAERNRQIEQLNEERIRDADNAARTIARFAKEIAEDEKREEEAKQRDFERIRDRARQEQARIEDLAKQKRLRAIERENERLLQPYVELGNDITENLSDAIVNGLTEDSLFDFIERSWADFVSRLLQAQLFQPFFDQIAEGFRDSLKPPAVAGTSTVALPEPDTRGGALAAQSATGSGLSGGQTVLLVAGGAAVQQLGREIGGEIGTALTVAGGAASGAAIGSAFGPYGTVIGAGIGAAVAGLPILFGGGEGEVRAQLRTGPTAPPVGTASDRFVAQSDFGFISFENAGTIRFDAAAAARFIANVDDSIAAVLTDRQEAVVAEVLGAQALTDVKGGSQEDVVAQLVFERITAAIDALAPGLSEDIFAGYEASAENIDNLVQTGEEILNILAVVDKFRHQDAPLNEAEQALRALDETFDDLAASARAYGLEEEARIIEQQKALERQRLTDDFNTQIRRERLAFEDPLALELELFEERRQAALENARTLGADLNAVEERYAAERLAIIEQFGQESALIVQQQSDFVRRIRGELINLQDPRQGALFNLEERRRAAIAEAERLGLDITLVERRYNEERRQLLERFHDEDLARVEQQQAELAAIRERRAGFIQEQQSALLGIRDPIQQQLFDLEIRRREALQTARELGVGIKLVEERYAAERLQIIERSLEQQLETIRRDFSAIDEFISGFQIGAEGGLPLNDRAILAQEAFARALEGDDVNAVIRAADDLLQIERERLASSPEFFRQQERVFELLEQFRSREELEDQNAIQQEQLERQRQIVQLMGDQTLRIAAGNSHLQSILQRITLSNDQQTQMINLLSRINLGAAGVR